MSDIDKRLIKKCIDGKEKSIHSLYNICFNDMYKVSARYGKHPEDIQEIIDNSFLKILKGLKSYSDTSKFGSWVRTIAINTALDFVRKKQRELKLFSDVDISAEANVNAQPTQAWDDSLEAGDIFKMMQQLPEQNRIILNLFAIEGYSHREIGDMLEISETASRWYLSEARKMMKKHITSKNKYRHEGA